MVGFRLRSFAFRWTFVLGRPVEFLYLNQHGGNVLSRQGYGRGVSRSFPWSAEDQLRPSKSKIDRLRHSKTVFVVEDRLRRWRIVLGSERLSSLVEDRLLRQSKIVFVTPLFMGAECCKNIAKFSVTLLENFCQ